MTIGKRIRIGARRSRLSQAQAGLVARALEAGGAACEIIPMRTQADDVPNQPLWEMGGKALFVGAIQEALLAGQIDIAVHSMKDMPAQSPEGLRIVACLARGDARDSLVATGARSLRELPDGARVGVAGPRRAAQIRAARADLRIVPLRGNVDTRLRKLRVGAADALLLASAGLERLGKGDVGTPLAPEEILPAAGQGAIAIEARTDKSDAELRALLTSVDDAECSRCVEAERAFTASFGADCRAPVAALCILEDAGATLYLRTQILSADGQHDFVLEARGPAAESQKLGERLAHETAAEADQSLFPEVFANMTDIK